MCKTFLTRLFIILFCALPGTQAYAALTGPFHEAHVKEFFFSKYPIVPGQERPDLMTTEFNAGDTIYGIFYFDGGAADWGSPDDEFIDFTVNGEHGTHVIGIDMRPLIRANLTYMKLEIIPFPQNAIMQDQAVKWADHVISLFQPGSNEVNLFLYGVSAAFTVNNWDPALLPQVKDNAAQAYALAEVNLARSTELPSDFITYGTNWYSDPVLSTPMLTQYFQQGYSDSFQQMLMIEFPQTSEQWFVDYDDWGIPVRQLTWNIGFLYKHQDGSCKYVYVPVMKEYLGGGTYGAPKLFLQGEGRSGHVRIDCAKAGLPSDLAAYPPYQEVILPEAGAQCSAIPSFDGQNVHVPQLSIGNGVYLAVDFHIGFVGSSIIATVINYTPIAPSALGCDSEAALGADWSVNMPVLALNPAGTALIHDVVLQYVPTDDGQLHFALKSYR